MAQAIRAGTVAALPDDLAACVRAAVGGIDPELRASVPEWLVAPRPAPLDFVYLLCRDRRRRPALVFRVSAPGMPDQVARGMRGAREAAAALPEPLARLVQLPLAEGRFDGRSWAVQRYVPPVSRRRPLRALQVQRLRPLLLGWLRAVAAATRHPATADGIAGRLRPALERLRAFPQIGERVERACARALARLDSGGWRPKWTLAHNDFWLDNVLLENPLGTALGRRPRPSLIDWPAARVDGLPVYDLVRLAQSIGLGRDLLRRELIALADLLGDDPADLAGYLLCTTGEMAADLENFPPDWFRATVARSLDLVDGALA